MPVVKKRQREDGGKTNEQVKRRKKCKEYTEFDNIGYQDDHWHTTFRCLPDNIGEVMRVLSRHIGSFLNGDGGILCFGVRKTGVIYGDEISRKEEDNLKLIIDEIFKKMTPHVPTDTYRVTFTPVVSTSHCRRGSHKEATKLQVLEIRVAPGDPFSLYEDQNHETYLRKGDQPYGPLTPHDIKRHTVQQLTKQLKSHKDFAKLFEKPEKRTVTDKENSSVVAKNKKSSSGSQSPKKKSNQSFPSKSSRLSAKVTLEKCSSSLRPSLLSKTEQSSELASRKTQAPSKAKAVSGSKERPIVLSSGESDHEAPLPSMHPRKRISVPKKNTVEQPVEKPRATIKPFQIMKKVPEPIIAQMNCLGEPPDEDQVAPVKKCESSLPPVEKQPAQQEKKVSESTIALAKVAPSQKAASSLPLVEKQPTNQILKPPPVQGNTITRPKRSLAKTPTKKAVSPIMAPEKQPTNQILKLPPVQGNTITRPKQSLAKAPTKKAVPPIMVPAAIPPPPRPPPSFSLHTHLQALPHYDDYHHDSRAHYYKYESYNYSHCSYPIRRGSSHPAHPLATSYSASYYQRYY